MLSSQIPWNGLTFPAAGSDRANGARVTKKGSVVHTPSYTGTFTNEGRDAKRTKFAPAPAGSWNPLSGSRSPALAFSELLLQNWEEHRHQVAAGAEGWVYRRLGKPINQRLSPRPPSVPQRPTRQPFTAALPAPARSKSYISLQRLGEQQPLSRSRIRRLQKAGCLPTVRMRK